MNGTKKPQKRSSVEPTALPPPLYPEPTVGAYMRPIPLPDGTTAYIPVDEAAVYSPAEGECTSNPPAAVQEDRSESSDPYGLYEDEEEETEECCNQRLTPCRLVIFRSTILSCTVLGLVLSIAGASVGMQESSFLYNSTSFSFIFISSILLLSLLGVSIPALVLASIFLHIGRKYPVEGTKDRQDRSLTEAQRWKRALFRVVYDVNITKALFATLMITTVIQIVGCGLTLAGELGEECYYGVYYYNYYYGYEEMCESPQVHFGPPVSGPLALVAAVLFLMATILTPIRCLTGGSLHLPAAIKKENGGEGCCFYI